MRSTLSCLERWPRVRKESGNGWRSFSSLFSLCVSSERKNYATYCANPLHESTFTFYCAQEEQTLALTYAGSLFLSAPTFRHVHLQQTATFGVTG